MYEIVSVPLCDLCVSVVKAITASRKAQPLSGHYNASPLP